MRLIQLDILRAVAILLVMGAHIPSHLIDADTPASKFLHLWQKCGWTGVDLFFVLSGFLVSGLLFREYKQLGEIKIGRFFVRRGLKIYPAFYVFILITSVLTIFFKNAQPTIWQYLSELLYVQNYGSNIWEHTWSLAVEEHFYLLIGFFIYFRTRFQRSDPFKIFILLFVLFSIAIWQLRFLNAYYFTYTHKTHIFPTHLRIDALLFGVILSYLHHYKQEKFKPWVIKNKFLIATISSLLISPCFFWSIYNFQMHTVGLTSLYLGYGGLMIVSIYCFDTQKAKPNKIVNTLASMGLYSYSIYLWHIAVAKWAPAVPCETVNFFPWFFFINLYTYVGGSIAIGVVMARLIELPTLKLRDKIFPSRSGQLE